MTSWFDRALAFLLPRLPLIAVSLAVIALVGLALVLLVPPLVVTP